MGIAFDVQLIISASQLSDVGIDQIDREAITLLKHPDSFCTTLTQIAEEGLSASKKAHGNMQRIQYKMERVLTEVKNCMEHTRRSEPVEEDDPKKLLLKLLERIKKAATKGDKLIQEVCDVFDAMVKLVGQVICAITASKRAKKMDIKKIENQNEEKIKDLERVEADAEKKMEDKIEKEVEECKANLQEKAEYMDAIRKSNFIDLLHMVGMQGKKKALRFATQMEQEAEQLLEKEKKEAEEEKQKIKKESGEKKEEFAKMRADARFSFDSKDELKLLTSAMQFMGHVIGKFQELSNRFCVVKNYFDQVTLPRLEEQKDSASIEVFIQRQLQFCQNISYTAQMYVRVSDKYMMKSTTHVPLELTLALGEHEENRQS
jgi:hypothetical protein